jgi:hypothetical protein
MRRRRSETVYGFKAMAEHPGECILEGQYFLNLRRHEFPMNSKLLVVDTGKPTNCSRDRVGFL